MTQIEASESPYQQRIDYVLLHCTEVCVRLPVEDQIAVRQWKRESQPDESLHVISLHRYLGRISSLLDC